ncbi:MAG: hypothetical protein KKB31_01790 [Nanoarchaeota archaeon]|nr:hypothetical protein [Nanoarchaeota archaeon]
MTEENKEENLSKRGQVEEESPSKRGQAKEELSEVEVWEFALDGEDIDELISKLNELKKTKKSLEFEIDSENELLIHYDEDVEESKEEGEEENGTEDE